MKPTLAALDAARARTIATPLAGTRKNTATIYNAAGKQVGVSIPPREDPEGRADAEQEMLGLLQALVVGHDQGGVEVNEAFIERVRSAIARFEAGA